MYLPDLPLAIFQC